MHFQYNFSVFSFKANLKLKCCSMLLLKLRRVSTCGAAIRNFTTSASSVISSLRRTVLLWWLTTGRLRGYFVQGFSSVFLTMETLRVRSPRLTAKEKSKVHCHGERPFDPWSPKPAPLLLVLLPSPPFSWLHGVPPVYYLSLSHAVSLSLHHSLSQSVPHPIALKWASSPISLHLCSTSGSDGPWVQKKVSCSAW